MPFPATPSRRALAAGLALALGLAAAPAGAAEKPAAKQAAPARPAAAQQGTKAKAKPKPKPRKAEAPRLPFVEGDYGQALADAKARNVPLVVDVWAPW